MLIKYTTILFVLSSLYSYGQLMPPPINQAQKSIDTEEGVDSVRIEFVGDGNLQKSLNEGTDFAANTGAGVIFQRIWTDSVINVKCGKLKPRFTSDIIVDFSINVASTVDTVFAKYDNGLIANSRAFGTHVLLPSNSGQAFKFKFYHYFNPSSIDVFKYLSGWNLNVSGSNRIWQDSIKASNVTTFSARLGVFHDFMPNSMRLINDYSIRIGAAFTYRGIFGDAGFGTDAANEFRKSLLGSDGRNYIGAELFGELKFKNLVFGVSIPIIGGNQNILGLSGVQFVTSVGFVGGFRIDINEKKDVKIND